MNRKMKNDFRFWVPLEISKAKDKEGNEVMRMGGIASTIDKDSDGEVLDPSGFDLTALKSTGFLNWHHQQKNAPLAIIGEPTKAEIRKEGLYLEGELYNHSPLAKQVYQLAEVLEKSSKTRRLGFSIEGKTLEKDPLDPTKILKAKITGCAITYMPKNAATFANIIKGDDLGLGELDYEVEEIQKGEENGGMVKYLLNMKTKDGKTVRVTESGEIDIDLSKSLTTEPESGGALKKEHVDSGLKEIIKSEDISKELSKAEVFDKIFSDFPDIELTKAKQVFKIITKISQMSKIKAKPTQDDISKAYEILGISNDETSEETELQKGEEETDEEIKKGGAKKYAKKAEEATTEEETEEEETEEEEEETEEVSKGGDEGEEEETEEEEEKEVEKSEESKSLYLKKGDDTYVRMINKGGELEEEEGKTFIKKGEDFVELTKSPIEKALENNLKEIKDSQGEIMKAIGTVVTDLKGQVAALQSQVTELSSQPQGRKSVAKVTDKKFVGDNELEKGKSDGQFVSINNRPAVLKVLEKATFAPLSKGGDDIDAGFEKALQVFEASGQLSKDVQNRLDREYGIIIGA